MNWRQIGIAVSLYNGQGPMFPAQPFNPNIGYDSRYITTIQNLNAPQIKHFLNSWGRMRMSFDVNRIHQAINNSNQHLNNLRGYNFITINLNNVRPNIIGLFNNFLNVGSKRSPVASSKIIHVLLPDLLLMWDNAIKTGYGCGYYGPLKGRTLAQTYVEFLKRVQRKLLNCLSSYSNQLGLGGVLQASNYLRNQLYQGGIKSMAKIVDEYNFQKFTIGSDQLW